MLVKTNELFDEFDECVAIESLRSTNYAEKYVYMFLTRTNWQSNACSAAVHAAHVHIWPEESDFAVRVSVRLETLKQALGIVEHGSTWIER